MRLTQASLFMRKKESAAEPDGEEKTFLISVRLFFAAVFLYGLYHGRDILECLIYGNATGGRCVEQVGCLSARLSEEQLKAEVETIRSLL